MSFSAPFCFDSFNRLHNEKKKTSLLHKWFTSCCENVIRDKNKVFFLGDDIKCRHGKSTEQTRSGREKRKGEACQRVKISTWHFAWENTQRVYWLIVNKNNSFDGLLTFCQHHGIHCSLAVTSALFNYFVVMIRHWQLLAKGRDSGERLLIDESRSQVLE